MASCGSSLPCDNKEADGNFDRINEISTELFILYFYLYHFLLQSTLVNIAQLTREGVPELQGPASGCMSAIDRKSAYIFCKENCIGLHHGQEY